MSYNLSDYKDDSSGIIESVPEGRYVVKIDNVDVKQTAKGKDMLALTLTVVEGKYKKRKFWHNLTLDPKALRYTIEVLKACKSDLITKDNVTAKDMANAMTGKVVSVYAEPGVTNQNKPTSNISKFAEVEGYSSNENSGTNNASSNDEDNLDSVFS